MNDYTTKVKPLKLGSSTSEKLYLIFEQLHIQYRFVQYVPLKMLKVHRLCVCMHSMRVRVCVHARVCVENPPSHQSQHLVNISKSTQKIVSH